MSRLKLCAEKASTEKRKLLIPYIVAGDPNLALSLDIMHALAAQGADAIELGIPFSDPASDGPAIQRAGERALAAGTTLFDVLQLVKKFRESNNHIAIVLMGYLNPIERFGYERFVDEAASCGVDGVLIVDMPAAESGDLCARLQAVSIDSIFLVAPTTSDERAAAIAKQCSGYLYYVSLKGVTGAAISEPAAVKANIEKLRQHTTLPIVVGFGIKDEASAKQMSVCADGVIVGTALVNRIAALRTAISDSSQSSNDQGKGKDLRQENDKHSRAGVKQAVSLIGDIRRALDKG